MDRRGLSLLLSAAVHAAVALLCWLGVRSVRPLAAAPETRVGPIVTLVSFADPAPAGGSSRPAEPPKVVGLENLPSITIKIDPTPAERPAAGTTAVGSTGFGSGNGTSGPTFLKVPTTAKSVVFLIDRSLSMGFSGALDAARQELNASLSNLAPQTRFQVLLYNRQVQPLFADGLRAADAETLRKTSASLADVLPEGATDHQQALRAALLLQPEVIFLVTDADDLTPEQVRQVTQMNHGRTAIHTIELGRRYRPTQSGNLAQLAQANHGTYRTVGR